MVRTIALLSVAFSLVVAAPAAAETFTVNSALDGTPGATNGICDSDPGAPVVCTLREAILEANNDPATTNIFFAIGSGRQEITLTTPLAAINAPVAIDGRTQPQGLATGGARIVLNPSDVATVKTLLSIQSSNVQIYGLAFGIDYDPTLTDFPIGIVIGGLATAFTNVVIQENWFGVNPAPPFGLRPVAIGVDVAGSQGALIGTDLDSKTDPQETNLFGYAVTSAIRVRATATDTLIRGNFIGLFDGGPVPNNVGIAVQSPSVRTIIGGDAGQSLAENIISGNVGAGITGTAKPGAAFPSFAVGRNAIYDNDGLGIDLLEDGVTPNDGPEDLDDGPNKLQNFPVIASAVPDGAGGTTISGVVPAVPSHGFITVQFFRNTACDPSGYGEGQVFLGSVNVATTDAGAVFSASYPNVAVGRQITATATSVDGTSEFSACVENKVPPVPTPTPGATATAVPSATVTATATPVPASPFADPQASAADLALACAGAPIVMIDVIRLSRRRVLVSGAAIRALRGKVLDILLDGKKVGTATVDATGLFESEVPAPRSAAQSRRARYRARAGLARSHALKLDRRMIVTRVSAGAVVTIRGRVLPPLANPPRPITFSRQTSCTRFVPLATVKPRRDGSFTATLPLPPAPFKAAVYRGASGVLVRKGAKKVHPTFTLPRAVAVR